MVESTSKPVNKSVIQLLDEADGEPRWLAQALEAIWQRLPPIPPPAPSKTGPPLWDPKYLALLQIDLGSVPLTAKNRWYLADWLKKMATDLIEGTLDEGDSHQGFRTIFVLGKTAQQ